MSIYRQLIKINTSRLLKIRDYWKEYRENKSQLTEKGNQLANVVINQINFIVTVKFIQFQEVIDDEQESKENLRMHDFKTFWSLLLQQVNLIKQK